MKTLVISKPVYDYILPLVEFPKDGDKFYIEKAINTISGHGSIIALTLGKYGMDVDFTGVVGEDDVSKNIKDIFTQYQVKLKYLETCYTEKSLISYKIYNSKTNNFTNINEIGAKTGLTKYKYEFIPDVVIMDDKDYNANLAALNNYPNSLLIYIAEKYGKQSEIYLNKCKYVISTLSFASEASGVNNGLDKEKNLVLLFQKFIDLYNTNLIIKLDNFDFLYCVDDEVRIIKNINKSIKNKESIYYGVLIYFLINKYSIEESIKLTNKAMLESTNDIDLVNDIPDYKVIEKVIREYEEYKRANVLVDINLNNQINNKNTESTNSTASSNNISENVNIQNSVQSGQIKQDAVQQQTVNPVKLYNPNLNNQNNNIEQLDVVNNQNSINTNGVNNG